MKTETWASASAPAPWRKARADQLEFLVDGEAYFHRLEEALRTASGSIWIVGWDFNPDICLSPDRGESEIRLSALLRQKAEQPDGPEIRILVWSMGPLYSGKSTRLYREQEWADHPKIQFRFDTEHPVRGSVHQKMVCIDGAIAFVGGIDLTAGRWDTRDHQADDPRRREPSGKTYGPVHDVQVMVSGPAAQCAEDIIQARWRAATDEDARQSDAGEQASWPVLSSSHLFDCDVLFALTEPSQKRRRARRETLALTCELLKSANESLYIEAQYLASFKIAKLLARRLREPSGPDIVLLVTSTERGVMERWVMGASRNRIIRRLMAADRFGRLRAVYAVVSGEDGMEKEVLIHSKVIIADDTAVRVGSSNLNNRSEGMDTECDIAVYARNEKERQAIGAFRNGLLAEHLSASPADVAKAIRETSLSRAVDKLNIHPRGVRPLSVAYRGATVPPITAKVLDPAKPLNLFGTLRDGVRSFASRFRGRAF